MINTIKMGNLVYILLGLVFYFSVLSGADHVPVFLWDTKGTSSSDFKVSALHRLDTDEFSDLLHKKVRHSNPCILVFLEETLSLEDWSWRDVDDNSAFRQLRNMSTSSGDIAFFPSVHNPYKALRGLLDYGFTWRQYDDKQAFNEGEGSIVMVKLNEPDSMEDRPDMLRSHDEQIMDVTAKALHTNSRVVVVYSGHHSSWSYGNRVRRQVEASEKEEEGDITLIKEVAAGSTKSIIVYSTGPFIFKVGTDERKLVSATAVTTQMNGSLIELDVAMVDETGGKVSFDFKFAAADGTGWTLSSVYLELEKVELYSATSIYGPQGYSYFCSQEVVFQGGQYSLTLKDLQVQPFAEDKKFGPPIDCVPWFTTAIWSGIFVVLLLGLVMAWGVIMIMDINTNDRFDDPKGKTITISAVD